METASQLLHRLTSMSEFAEDWGPPVDDPRVVRSFEPNDIDRLPWFFKRYDVDLPVTALPRELPRSSAAAMAVLAGTADVPAGRLDVAQLARLLHLCAGVTRTSQRSYGSHLFRAAGSAGGRFPLEVYVTVPDGHELPPGVHWYHPQDHALVRVGPPPRGEAPTVVVTGVPWRTGWRYRERGYRHVYWDAGTMLSQLVAAADAVGIPAHLRTRFPDLAVAELVGADGVHEWPVATVTLGDGMPAIDAAQPAVAGAIDAAPVEFPLATAAQRAGDATALGDPRPRGAAGDVTAAGPTIDEVILARGSQRLMDPTQSLPLSTLTSSMAVAMRGIDVLHWVAAHQVDDLAPGLYRWPELSAPIRTGDLREELHRFCLDQRLGSEASFVVVSAEDITAIGDRGYREAQLAAGLAEGRLHLAAYALGASASGMTFLDGSVADLLGQPMHGLLVTCVGVPEYRSTPGGPPGAPNDVALVAPRF